MAPEGWLRVPFGSKLGGNWSTREPSKLRRFPDEQNATGPINRNWEDREGMYRHPEQRSVQLSYVDDPCDVQGLRMAIERLDGEVCGEDDSSNGSTMFPDSLRLESRGGRG